MVQHTDVGVKHSTSCVLVILQLILDVVCGETVIEDDFGEEIAVYFAILATVSLLLALKRELIEFLFELIGIGVKFSCQGNNDIFV